MVVRHFVVVDGSCCCFVSKTCVDRIIQCTRLIGRIWISVVGRQFSLCRRRVFLLSIQFLFWFDMNDANDAFPQSTFTLCCMEFVHMTAYGIFVSVFGAKINKWRCNAQRLTFGWLFKFLVSAFNDGVCNHNSKHICLAHEQYFFDFIRIGIWRGENILYSLEFFMMMRIFPVASLIIWTFGYFQMPHVKSFILFA